MKARIYEIKSKAVANAELLRDEENDRFYWNDFKFGGFGPEDHWFIVNPHKKWAIYGRILETDIPTKHDPKNQVTRFEHDGRSFDVEDPIHFFKKFVCLKIIQDAIIPEGWHWTKLIGQSDAYDLFKVDISKPLDRLQKVDDLVKLFPDGDAFAALGEIRAALEGTDAGGLFTPPSTTADPSLKEAFRRYLQNEVRASANTVQQYVAAMGRLQDWFVEHGACSPGYEIWRDTSAVPTIQEQLEGPVHDAWTEFNHRQNNSSRAPWNHWRKFLAGREQSGLLFSHTHREILSAIKTKPFILLAGISGTGKSRMVRALAYLTCPTDLQEERPMNFQLVMVKPNWHDPTELIGYVSRISGKAEYVVTEFLRFLVRAWLNPDVPFFLCLDEMNLAPVEQYFADYLSVVETRRINVDGALVTDAILSADKAGGEEVFAAALEELGLRDSPDLLDRFLQDGLTLPRNLVVMGTVNMDETTHSFSRKVLDRAMTFEMNEVNLRGGLEPEERAWSYPEEPLAADYVLGRITRGGDVPVTMEGYDQVLDRLVALNKNLDHTPFKVAYRVRDEFLIYVYHNSQLKLKPTNWLDLCLDELVVMKVLARIEGDEGKVGKVLKGLLEAMPEKWINSRAKVLEMQERLMQSGYTSFWS
ncbi:MAG: AAA family ATPase [Flavobacteriales bacterium]